MGVSIVFFCFVSATAYYKENGLADVMKLHSAITAVKQEIHEFQAENSRIRLELDSLNHNDTYVEAIVREELGLVKPGEVVYEFIDAKRLTYGEEE